MAWAFFAVAVALVIVVTLINEGRTQERLAILAGIFAIGAFLLFLIVQVMP
ncbi:hypothetical protein CDZ95_26245 [Mameliella alba]|nr:hypothetical protein CDZ95_26245 [Mameliella alba]